MFLKISSSHPQLAFSFQYFQDLLTIRRAHVTHISANHETKARNITSHVALCVACLALGLLNCWFESASACAESMV
jgi:hypothetical protein